MSFRQRAYFDQHPPPPPSPQKEALKGHPYVLVWVVFLGLPFVVMVVGTCVGKNTPFV